MRKLLFLIAVFIFFIQPCFAIKIGLQTNVNKTYIGASTKAEIIDCKTNKLIFIMDEMKGYEFKPHRGFIAIKIDGEVDYDPAKIYKAVAENYDIKNNQELEHSEVVAQLHKFETVIDEKGKPVNDLINSIVEEIRLESMTELRAKLSNVKKK